MASNKPVIHGRDHLPGGADPIPTKPLETHTVAETSTIAVTTVAASASVQMSWANLTNGPLLDYSDPQQPAVPTDGVYSVSVNGSLTTGVSPAVLYQLSLIVVRASLAAVRFTQSVVGDGTPALGATDLSVSGVVMMNAGDAFEIDVFNGDTVSDDVTFWAPYIEVTRILQL